MTGLVSASIIIPVYRNQATIERALNSVVRSWLKLDAFQGLGIDVIFDGSDRSCLNVVGNFSQHVSIPVRITQVPHGGIGYARNIGWRQTEADIITFLDADDEITEQRLKEVHRISLQPHSMRKQQMIIGLQRIFNPNRLRLPGSVRAFQESSDSISPYFMSLVTTRETLESISGFNEKLALGDDWDLMIRAREAGIALEYSNEIFTYRHIDGHNSSYQEGALVKEYIVAIREHHRRSHRGS